MSRCQFSSGAFSIRNSRTSFCGSSGKRRFCRRSSSSFCFLLFEELRRIDVTRPCSRWTRSFATIGDSSASRRWLCSALDEHGVLVDEIFDATGRRSRKTLDGLEPVPVDVLPDLRGVIRHRVHHFAIRLREPDVVLEEVAVAVHVRHDDLLIDEVIALEQIRVAGIVVDDHLVDLVQTVRVALVQPLVLHAELPVRIAIRESAVGRDHVHFFEVEHLEEWFRRNRDRTRARTASISTSHALEFRRRDCWLRL